MPDLTMPDLFDLDQTDRLLATTRSVRRRLDLSRSVPIPVILDCLRLAVQAPTGGNRQGWRWLVVTDVDKKRELARLYRDSGKSYFEQAARDSDHPQTRRVYESALVLADTLERVPVHVIPCIEGRAESTLNALSASAYGSIIPAVWSFMLALRSRGLGTAWTTVHLAKEQEAAALLGIPFDEVTQVALLPVGYTVGTDFKPAARPPVESITYWDSWGATHPDLSERSAHND
jgi:nitroreductase